MKPDAHHPTSEELFAYRDGELSNERRTLVEAHVLVCAQCRERVDEMSAVESDLRMRPDDVGDEYYERMTEAVLARAAAPAPPEEEVAEVPAAAAVPRRGGKARRGLEPPPYERRRPEVVSDEIDVRRRFRLPWIGIAGSGAAAAAVMIVAVILFQRQQEWMRAPRPASVGQHETPVPETRAESKARNRKSSAPAVGEAGAKKTATGAAMGDKGAAVAMNEKPQALSKTQAKAPFDASTTQQGGDVPPVAVTAPVSDLAREETTTRDELGTAERADKDAPSADGNASKKMSMTPGEKSAASSEGNDSSITAGVRQQAAPMASLHENQESRSKVDQLTMRSAVAPGAPGEPYAAVLREYSLPAVWNSSVSREVLLKAEPELRRVYQTHKAGADSARIRLYLAESERAKMGNPPDSARMEAAVNHYRRTIALALAHGDNALADVARKRLAQLFGVTQPSNPAPSGTR